MQKLQNGRVLYYGKGDVLTYRTYAKPLEVEPIRESAYTGDPNVIFAHNVHFSVSGEQLLTSFTEGSNELVVATDSMKNFILRETMGFAGSTTEGFLAYIAGKFIRRYAHIESVTISADRIPFLQLPIPDEGGFRDSELVYRRSHNDHASSQLKLVRTADGSEVTVLTSSLSDLQLIKVSGSSFYGFVRDEYTTLPDSYDRPLFIFLDIHWTYTDAQDAIDADSGRYVAAEQIRDIAHTLFHENKSPSIQYLIYLIGIRMLERFPQLAEVRFESNNRTWETFVEPEVQAGAGVYTEPRPPFGFQGFSLTRADLTEESSS